MARIKIEDLPATRELTPEQMLALFGVGASWSATSPSRGARRAEGRADWVTNADPKQEFVRRG
jgi:hypothetical protein